MTLTNVRSITLDEGWEIMTFLLSIAERDGLKPAAICIVDAHGDQVCAATMPGTKIPSIAHAHAKAVTAVRFERDTITFRHVHTDPELRVSQGWLPNPDGYSEIDIILAAKTNPVFCSWGGGVRILSPHDDSIIGAVGVSNRSEQEDHELASQRPSGWSA